MSKLQVSSHSIGKNQGPNEDAYKVESSIRLYVVADGMGGSKRGDLASQFTCETISQTFQTTSLETEKTWPFEKKEGLSLEENFLRMAFLKTQTQLLARADQEQKRGWMGCSAVAGMLIDEKFIVAAIGNCRAYAFRNGELTQLTTDNSLATHRKILAQTPMQNIPLNFLGKEGAFDIDSSLIKYPKKGDLYLLCSAGITHGLTPAEILAEINKNYNNINVLCKSLVEKAHHTHPSLDATIICIAP